jgi:hypothetical protein
VKEFLLGCDRLEVYRTQIQAVADSRDAQYDMSANIATPSPLAAG